MKTVPTIDDIIRFIKWVELSPQWQEWIDFSESQMFRAGHNGISPENCVLFGLSWLVMRGEFHKIPKEEDVLDDVLEGL